MSVISTDVNVQADNLAVVRDLLSRSNSMAIGIGNYTNELDRLQGAFTELDREILFMVADGDAVMTRFRMTGTMPSHGAVVTSTGLMVHRVVDGRVVEAWIDYDRAGVTKATA